jgi:hypothetical protein
MAANAPNPTAPASHVFNLLAFNGRSFSSSRPVLRLNFKFPIPIVGAQPENRSRILSLKKPGIQEICNQISVVSFLASWFP